MSETRVRTREALIFTECVLHACFLRLAEQAAVFDGVCEGLLFSCHVVPVRANGLGVYFWGDVFAEEVAVEEDSFVFLFSGDALGNVLDWVREGGWIGVNSHHASAFVQISIDSRSHVARGGEDLRR